MDASERLSVALALQHALKADAAAADVVVSAFAAALKSARRATLCRPWPGHMGMDYAAAAAALDALPGTAAQLAADEALLQEAVGAEQLRLLQFVLLHLQLKQQHQLVSISKQQLLEEVAGGLGNLADSLAGCRCIVKLQRPQQAAAAAAGGGSSSGATLLAYHGTSFANLHSIMHNGLLVASGTRLQASGALFGDGVYLAEDYHVALSFSAASDGWARSAIGRALRCVLVCEADAAAAVRGASGGGAAARGGLPDKYVLARRPQDVRLRYVLLYSDDLARGHTRAVRHPAASVCLCVTLAYLAAVLLLAAWRSVAAGRTWYW